MDKNIGEQLNRAYEAFRQACMDRDSAVRELQQKVCGLGFENWLIFW
jgi:TRAF family protein-associated NF-kappa-B activator